MVTVYPGTFVVGTCSLVPVLCGPGHLDNVGTCYPGTTCVVWKCFPGTLVVGNMLPWYVGIRVSMISGHVTGVLVTGLWGHFILVLGLWRICYPYTRVVGDMFPGYLCCTGPVTEYLCYVAMLSGFLACGNM